MPNELESTEEWLNHVPAPSLFRVIPEGCLGEGEGLISLFVAIARAHCVSPRVLMKHLLQNSEKYRDIWSGTAFFDRDCTTVNGHGNYARLMVILLAAGAPASLAPLTLLHMEGLLPHNGEGTLGRHPKWCSLCLCDQARANRRPHFRLLWSLEHYRVCHEHKVVLSDRCPACGALQSFIPVYPSLVHCNACRGPLLADFPEEIYQDRVSFTDYELWCAHSLATLFECREEIQSRGSMVIFRENIAGIVKKLSPGSKKRLCELIGLQAYALNGWLNKDERPSLSVLLRFGYGISVEVAALFLPGAVALASQPNGLIPPEIDRNARPMLGFQQRQDMGRLLEVIIADSSDNRALVSVAEQLGLTRSALKYWFRAECVAIVRKNRSSESLRLSLKYQREHDLLRSIVQLIRSRNLPLSRRRVDLELRRNGLSLMRPDIFQAYERLKGNTGLLARGD